MQDRALVLEAHHTTHIEGTHLKLDQSERLLAGEKVANVDAEDVKELLNYRKAFDFVADYVVSQGAITEGLIREIHRHLVADVRGNTAQPGQYRVIQNYVANSKTKEVIYTPPPAYEVSPLMAELVDWLQNEQAIPRVLAAGIAQFQLVHIHPFLDGNGRTARLLSTLCLYRSGYDFKKLFTISEYYDRNRQDYYNATQSVRQSNMDMTEWLEYFTKALETQIHEIQYKGSLSKIGSLSPAIRTFRKTEARIGKPARKREFYNSRLRIALSRSQQALFTTRPLRPNKQRPDQTRGHQKSLPLQDEPPRLTA